MIVSPFGLSVMDGSYGLSVWAAVLPSFVEFWEAVETAPLSGTYGSFAMVGPAVPSVPDDWTTYRNVAPNDGLRRQIKARHVRDGATTSVFSTAVTLAPWGPAAKLPLSPPTRAIPTADDGGWTPVATVDYNLSSGILPTSGVVEGSSTFKLYRHREDITVLGADTDGDVAYSFANTYQNVPQITFRGGQFVTFSNTIGTSVKQRTRVQVLNATASGFTSRCQICSVGVTTAQAQDFASGNSVTVVGNDAQVTTSNAPSNDNNYTVNYYVQVVLNANSTTFCVATLTMAIDTWDGSSWTERATFSYTASPNAGPPPYSSATSTYATESKLITVSGLVSTDKIRVRAKSFTISNGGAGSFTLRGADGAGANPETARGITYTTATDTTESGIPSNGDQVQWSAQEVA